MRAFAVAALVAALAPSLAACGDSSTSSAQLPKALHAFVRSQLKNNASGAVSEIDVYGPGSRTALNKAVDGSFVAETTRERQMRFYLLVLHGTFVCSDCRLPPGRPAPRGTIETRVWSPQEGQMDGGILGSLPAGVSSLHRIAVVKP